MLQFSDEAAEAEFCRHFHQQRIRTERIYIVIQVRRGSQRLRHAPIHSVHCVRRAQPFHGGALRVHTHPLPLAQLAVAAVLTARLGQEPGSHQAKQLMWCGTAVSLGLLALAGLAPRLYLRARAPLATATRVISGLLMRECMYMFALHPFAGSVITAPGPKTALFTWIWYSRVLELQARQQRSGAELCAAPPLGWLLVPIRAQLFAPAASLVCGPSPYLPVRSPSPCTQTGRPNSHPPATALPPTAGHGRLPHPPQLGAAGAAQHRFLGRYEQQEDLQVHCRGGASGGAGGMGGGSGKSGTSLSMGRVRMRCCSGEWNP